MIATTVYMNVVPPPPAGTTDPVLHGVPGNIEAITAGDAATVWWTDPTATDATDPSPTITCDPAGGTSFPVGTAAVTCTATDAAGNDAGETFHVTVVHETPAPPLTGTWNRPLDDWFPALTARAGRTIRLKLGDSPGGVAQTPVTIAAPALLTQRLAACTPDAETGAALAARTTPGPTATGSSSRAPRASAAAACGSPQRSTVARSPTGVIQLVPETATHVKANNNR